MDKAKLTKKEQLEFEYSEEKKRHKKLLELENKKKCHCSQKPKEQWASEVNYLQDEAITLRENKTETTDTSPLEKKYNDYIKVAAAYSGHYAYAVHMSKFNPSRGPEGKLSHKQYGKSLFKQAMKNAGVEPINRESDSDEDEDTQADWERDADEMKEQEILHNAKAMSIMMEINEIIKEDKEVLDLANEYEAKAAYAFAMAQPIQPIVSVQTPAGSESSSEDTDSDSESEKEDSEEGKLGWRDRIGG